MKIRFDHILCKFKIGDSENLDDVHDVCLSITSRLQGTKKSLPEFHEVVPNLVPEFV